MVVSIVIGIVSFVVGVFGFSQIIGSLACIDLRPRGSSLVTILLWLPLLAGGGVLVYFLWYDHILFFWIGYGVSFLLSLGSGPSARREYAEKADKSADAYSGKSKPARRAVKKTFFGIFIFLSMIYIEAIAVLILVFTAGSSYAIAAFSLVFAGAASIRTKWIRASRMSRPTMYCSSLVNLSLDIGAVCGTGLSIWLLIVDWKLFLITLLASLILSRNVLYRLAEILFAFPPYALEKAYLKDASPVHYDPREIASYGTDDLGDFDFEEDEPGDALGDAPAPPKQAPTAAAPSEPEPDIPPDWLTVCPSCGYETDGSKAFCNWCGALLKRDF